MNNKEQVSAIQRYKIGYHSDEGGVRSLSPTSIYDDAGPWVRYEDHVAEFRRLHAQQPAPAGATEEVENLRKALVYVAFALHDTPQYMLTQGITLIDGDTVRVSRDGWTVEASVNPHRQPAIRAALATGAAPAQAADSVVAYLDIGAGGYLDLGTDLADEALSRLPKGRHALVIAGTYGIDGYTAASTPQSAPVDAARWHWMAEYIIGTRTDLDDDLIASATVDELRKLVDADLAARKQGANHE